MGLKKEPGLQGEDTVSFLFSANKNGVLQNISSVASGGEMFFHLTRSRCTGFGQHFRLLLDLFILFFLTFCQFLPNVWKVPISN